MCFRNPKKKRCTSRPLGTGSLVRKMDKLERIKIVLQLLQKVYEVRWRPCGGHNSGAEGMERWTLKLAL